MDQNNSQGSQEPADQNQSLGQWQRFLSVTYRLVIILGLILFAIGLILVLFTTILPFWSLVFPAAIIVAGIILARLEYSFHKKLNH